MSATALRGTAGAVQPGALDTAADPPTARPAVPKRPGKPRCEDCFFHQNALCALEEKKPCPTFRPAHPDGLQPPRQLSFVFRQGRRGDPFSFEAPRA